jgi:two-component system, sensor histidine kinase
VNLSSFASVCQPWAAWQRWVAKHIEDAEQVNMQFAATRNSAITALAAAMVPSVYYWGRVDHWISVLWLACFASTLAVRGLLQRGFNLAMLAQQTLPPSNAKIPLFMPRWAALHGLSVASSGVLWGLTIWAFNPQHNFSDAMVGMVTLAGALLSGLFIFANFFPALLAYSLGIFVPSALGFALQTRGQGSEQSTAYALLTVLLLFFFVRYGRYQERKFVDGIRLRREREDMVQQLQAENLAKQQALAQAQEATAAKVRFFAAVSHDVRQPLYSLSLLAGTATSTMSDAQRQKLQQNIQHSVVMLDGLFTQLLQVSQLDMGALQPNLQTIDLKALIQAIVQTFSTQLDQKKIILSLDLVDAQVIADPAWLQRILLNLIGNALIHALPQTVLQDAPQAMLLVSTHLSADSAGYAVLSVQDNGCGIALAEQEKIFEEFYRLGQAPKSMAKTSLDAAVLRVSDKDGNYTSFGFGLGLPIVRRLARAMGTDVLVQSQPGQGCTFSIALPLARVNVTGDELGDQLSNVQAINHAHTVDTQSMPATSGLLSGALIGVLEDDESVGQALQTLLASWGARVVWARQADQALQWQAPLDALLVDYQLAPQEMVNGVQVAKVLRQRWSDSLKRPLPVLIVSSLHLNEEQTDGFDAVVKPLSPVRLRSWLLNALVSKN